MVGRDDHVVVKTAEDESTEHRHEQQPESRFSVSCKRQNECDQWRQQNDGENVDVLPGAQSDAEIRVGLAVEYINDQVGHDGARYQNSMIIHLGHVRELVRYPVKSMAGVATNSAFLGWHGLQGDRRFAFRRLNDNSGFPWLTASRLPELLLYQPLGFEETDEEPTHVRTPDGTNLPIGSPELQRSVADKLGSPVELMKLKHGIFDEASVSVINLATIAAIGREAGQDLDTRRFRANVVIESETTEPFLEDGWVGGRLVFGNDEAGPMVNVTMRDPRCVMINFDPDTAQQDPRVMKAAVRLNENNAGIYGSVARTGQITVGQPVRFMADPQT